MKELMKRFCVFLIVFFLVSPCAAALGETEDDGGGAVLAPYFFIESEDAPIDGFPLKETEVTVNINGVIADIYVVQTYSNEGALPLSAQYVFPAGRETAIHGMTMQVGDTVVTAQIKEKEEAQQVFEAAKSEGKSASLLQQQRPNVFTMNVANILPGDEVRIELHYSELITPAEGVYRFVFPTVVGPRYAGASTDTADKWVSSPYLGAENTPPGEYIITVNLSTGVPISGLACKSHKVDIARDGLSEARVTLSDPEDFAGNRDFILDYELTSREMESGLLLYKGEKENFFLMMVQPPERVRVEDIPPREYIFVLDVSGSMYGYPLDTAKALIKDLLTSLRLTDKFNLILFSGASFQMSPESVPATAENIRAAIYLIESQEGGGGTELLPALESSASIPKAKGFSRSIVVITDGYISAETEVFELISKNNGKMNFFSFGIGDGVNRYLIDGVAKAGLGESFVATDAADASVVAGRFRDYVLSPVLTDIRVTYEGFDVYDIEPLNVPDLFAQKPLILFGKWRGEPSGEIHIAGKTGSGEYRRTISVAESPPAETHSAIGYLWARTKIARLTDYGNSAQREDSREAVTNIGLEYSMMTPYTSFVAVIDTVRNPEKNSTDVNQPLPLPRNVSDFAIGSYLKASEPEDILFMAVASLTLAMSAICRARTRKKVRAVNEVS